LGDSYIPELTSYFEAKGWYKFEESYLQGPLPLSTPDKPYQRRKLLNFSELTETGKALIPIHKKITSFKCPISWYKNGEFKMISDTPPQTTSIVNSTTKKDSCDEYELPGMCNISGGKKNKTRRNRKNRKSKKNKK
jgi:hypothetical protein